MSKNSKINSKRKRNIIILGQISCFTKISSDSVAFSATSVLIGFIENIVESMASLLKVFSGYISD